MENEWACGQPETLAGRLLRRYRVLVLALLVFALPLPLEAQPAPKVVKIGLLTPSSPGGSGHLVEAFRQGFQALGYIEGKTFVLEARYGEGDPNDSQSLRGSSCVGKRT